jgi:hypothetical protein
MCNTYQQAESTDCECRYTFGQVWDETATVRGVIGGACKALLWLVGVAFVVVVWPGLLALGWCVRALWRLMTAEQAAPVAATKPVTPKAKPVAVTTGIPVVDWPRERIHILRNGGAK